MKLSTMSLIGIIAPGIGAAAGTYGYLTTNSTTMAFLEGILVAANTALGVVNFRNYRVARNIERSQQ